MLSSLFKRSLIPKPELHALCNISHTSKCAITSHPSTFSLTLQIGTNQMAVCAKAQNKPFYVVAESFKFVRLFPLNQQDVPDKFKARVCCCCCCCCCFYLFEGVSESKLKPLGKKHCKSVSVSYCPPVTFSITSDAKISWWLNSESERSVCPQNFCLSVSLTHVKGL